MAARGHNRELEEIAERVMLDLEGHLSAMQRAAEQICATDSAVALNDHE